MRHPGEATLLVIIAFAGQLLIYVLSILLARSLTVVDFEAYAVAAAAFVMLATFAPRGGEKYLLLKLPALLKRHDLLEARSLLAFAARRTLLTAIAVALVVGCWAAFSRNPADETRAAIIVTCAALPAGALVHLGVEALTASGRPVAGLTLFRILVPGLALLLSLLLLMGGGTVRGAAAIGAWGVAWLVGLIVVTSILYKSGLLSLRSQAAAPSLTVWKIETRPFFVYRVSLALLAQAGVIALDLFQASPAAVGAYAAAMGTVGVAAVLTTSTNRAYSRELALLLDREDFNALLALRRERLRWLGPAVLLLLTITFVFPAEILGLFRLEFAREGTTPLRILTAATAFTMIFSLAPTYLKYRQRNRETYATVAIAALVQMALLVTLIPRLGATGAALAYSIAMCGMYAAFAILGYRELARSRLVKND